MFDAKFQPWQLELQGFVDFTLHYLKDYRVDVDQPPGFTRVARPDGQPVDAVQLGRALREPLAAMGAVLTPGLLRAIIRTFAIHGPALQARQEVA